MRLVSTAAQAEHHEKHAEDPNLKNKQKQIMNEQECGRALFILVFFFETCFAFGRFETCFALSVSNPNIFIGLQN